MSGATALRKAIEIVGVEELLARYEGYLLKAKRKGSCLVITHLKPVAGKDYIRVTIALTGDKSNSTRVLLHHLAFWSKAGVAVWGDDEDISHLCHNRACINVCDTKYFFFLTLLIYLLEKAPVA